MPGPSAKSRPAFDQRAVFCKRHTRHGETDAGRGEGKRRLWRHVVESVLPGGRCVRHNAQRTALARSRPWKWDRRLPRRSDRCRRCTMPSRARRSRGRSRRARCRCRSNAGGSAGPLSRRDGSSTSAPLWRASTEMSENDAPVATPSRQEPVTCASMPETKPPRLRSAEAAFLLSSKSAQCPAHKQAVERQRPRPTSRGLDDLGPMCQIGPLARGRFACHHSSLKACAGRRVGAFPRGL